MMGVENRYRGVVTDRSPTEGMMRAETGGVELNLSLGEPDVGDEIELCIRASDVMLGVGELGLLSAQNILAGFVKEITFEGRHFLVRLDCGGLPVLAATTRQEVHNMHLEPGSAVWAIIKASSFFMLRTKPS